MKSTREEIEKARDYQVVKSNDLIRKARYDLSLSEIKAFSFIVSKVRPNDAEFCEYSFTINEYCQVLGIDTNNGTNIRNVKHSLKALLDKSFFVKLDDGTETSVHWLDKAWIDKKSGRVRIRFDEDMQKYICGLYSNYTQYELIICLPMRSSYSVRLYEMLKSYCYQGERVFDLDEMKKILSCEHYNRFPDFRRKVLDMAEKEINKYSDIRVSWEPITKGRKVTAVKFEIQKKSPIDRALAAKSAANEIDGQLSLSDVYPETE